MKGSRLKIDLPNGRGFVYSDSKGILGGDGMGHDAVRVGDMVFDNMRPEGIPYDQFIADLGGAAFFGKLAQLTATPF